LKCWRAFAHERVRHPPFPGLLCWAWNLGEPRVYHLVYLPCSFSVEASIFPALHSFWLRLACHRQVRTLRWQRFNRDLTPLAKKRGREPNSSRPRVQLLGFVISTRCRRHSIRLNRSMLHSLPSPLRQNRAQLLPLTQLPVSSSWIFLL